MTELAGSRRIASSNQCCAAPRLPLAFSASPSCTTAPRSFGWCRRSAVNSATASSDCPEQRVGAPELPARVAVVDAEAELLAQLRDAAVVVARVEVRDLEVALRDLHLRVELERLRERRRRLLVQPLVVVEHAEVVVRARVRRIDAPRERLAASSRSRSEARGRGHGRASSADANRAEDRREAAEVGQQQEEAAQRLVELLQAGTASRRRTRTRRPAPTSRNVALITASERSMASDGGDGSRIIPMNSLSAFRYARAEDVPRLAQRRLRRSRRAPSTSCLLHHQARDAQRGALRETRAARAP